MCLLVNPKHLSVDRPAARRQRFDVMQTELAEIYSICYYDNGGIRRRCGQSLMRRKKLVCMSRFRQSDFMLYATLKKELWERCVMG